MKKLFLVLACSAVVGLCAKHTAEVKKIRPKDNKGMISIHNFDSSTHKFRISGQNGQEHMVTVKGNGEVKISDLDLQRDVYKISVLKPEKGVWVEPSVTIPVTYKEGKRSFFSVGKGIVCSKAPESCPCIEITNNDDAPHTFRMMIKDEIAEVTVTPHDTGNFTPKLEERERVKLGISGDEGKIDVVLTTSNPNAVICYDDNHAPKLWECSPMKGILATIGAAE